MVDSLGIGIVWDMFHSAGSCPDLIERLNKEAIESDTEPAKFLSIHEEMPSGPDAVCTFSLLGRNSTSEGTITKESKELISGGSGMG